MKNRRNILMMWGISVIPTITLMIVYNKLSDIVPTSFGFDGSINAYGSKANLWLMAGMGPFFSLMFQVMPKIDPRRQNYEKFQKYYDLFAIFLQLFLMGIMCLMLTEIMRPGTVSIGRTVTVMVCILFMLMGNMMGKVKHNYFFGIRTPWTLADPDVWVRTHSIGGKFWFFLGALLLPCCLLLPEKVFFWLLMGGILISTTLLFVLSYWFYRQKKSDVL